MGNVEQAQPDETVQDATAQEPEQAPEQAEPELSAEDWKERAMQAERKLARALEEDERKQKELNRTRFEAAKYRVGKREVADEKKTLEDRMAQMEQRMLQKDVEVARERLLRTYSLPDSVVKFLGEDPGEMEERAKELSTLIPTGSKEAKPFPVERASGGSNPATGGDVFDAKALAQSFRRR